MRNSVITPARILLCLFVLLPVLSSCESPTESVPDPWDHRFELHLSTVAASTPMKFAYKVVLINKDKVSHDIVLPGDGSLDHLRTPCIGWSMIDAHNPAAMHPDTTIRNERLRCGNINSLRMEEIVTLQPGDSCDLGDWSYDWSLLEKDSGTYRVVFDYENRPGMEWKGVPLGVHDPAAMERVRKSTACKVRSNEILVNY